MNIVIVEDETPALNRIIKLVKEVRPEYRILGTADSIESAANLIEMHPEIDLALFDIELADGQSFELFSVAQIQFPVIFTTAYDEFALKAFKVNSIDYLLKPVTQHDLAAAFTKYESLRGGSQNRVQGYDDLLRLIKGNSTTPKERFLVKQGQRLITVPVQDILFFQAADKMVYLTTKEGARYVIDYSLEELSGMLETRQFFQLNRQYLASMQSIKDIHSYFNGKLKVTVQGSMDDEILVSRERASEFKAWLDS
ncbi:MAG: LytTR family DNA-binding domain-containing protein [Bacteroidetes bacterium]|nr:LytTR family DNA-binding domain-containing protein [Bacteroidota bacterium]